MSSSEIGNGLIIALIVQVVLVIIVWIFAKLKNVSLLRWFSASNFFGHGIECVYEKQDKALSDIKKDIEHSNEIKIFSMRGRIYADDQGELFYINRLPSKKIKYLLSNPDNLHIPKRAAEIERTTSHYKDKLLIPTFSNLSSQTKDNSNIERRIHNESPTFRLLILKDRIYFSFFEASSTRGPDLMVFRAKADSKIYRGFSRYYDYVWDQSNCMENY